MNPLRRVIDKLVGRHEPEPVRVDNRERRLRALEFQLQVIARNTGRTAVATESLAKRGKR